MATILIVDHRPSSREYLVDLLGYAGHRLLEAADGAGAFAITRSEHPDLIIADVLMSNMDGYELVRQLRGDPAVSQTPVIFCTVHYNEREVHPLAWTCGVSDLITKPSEPARILSAVETVLGIGRPIAAPPATEEFDRKHVRLLTDKLLQKTDELRATKELLSAAADLSLLLGSEHDLRRLLQGFEETADGREPAEVSKILQELRGKRNQRRAAVSSRESRPSNEVRQDRPPERITGAKAKRSSRSTGHSSRARGGLA